VKTRPAKRRSKTTQYLILIRRRSRRYPQRMVAVRLLGTTVPKLSLFTALCTPVRSPIVCSTLHWSAVFR
jgi:hypothetical protein